MKITTVVLAAMLVGTNAWWAFRTFDQGVTNTYRDQERYEEANRAIALTKLATEAVRGKTKSDAAALLRQLFPTDEPFEKDGALHAGWVELAIGEDGRVLKVASDENLDERAKPARTLKE